MENKNKTKKVENKQPKKKMNFFTKFLIYTVVFIALFVGTIWGTKYYFYDSDYAVKKTDLSEISIDKIKLGMNYSEIDVSKYKETNTTVDNCNYNFEEISIKTNSKGEITEIIAPYNKVTVSLGNDAERASKINDVWKALGSNYDNEIYKPKENNYWKITRYFDTENKIYLGIIYSRYNNEIQKIILSNHKIED